MTKTILTCACGLAALFVLVSTADAISPARSERVSRRFANTMSWNAPYAYTAYGQPLALVVPPTAATQVRMGWGVAQNDKINIYHQFGRAYPGEMMGGGGPVYGTPNWPSHTDQFGVYYVRGPW